MLLVCDAGNSNIVLGLYDGDELIANWRLTSRLDATVDEYLVSFGTLLSQFEGRDEIIGAVLSSVVPPLTESISSAIGSIAGVEPLLVGPGVRTGLDVQYDDPREVGADRIVNAVGALSRHEAPLVVVDFGTATTFDVILPPSIYLGGVIAPGLEIARDALIANTAMLPKVEIREIEQVVGRNTADSIRSGLYRGAGALVDGLVEAISKEQGIDPTVIATGGLAGVIRGACARIDHVEPDLTLWGLREVYLRNK
ncbi:type III pantothenate kinase [bacterium]|nr:type III pantothenate kinase [bacterium]